MSKKIKLLLLGVLGVIAVYATLDATGVFQIRIGIEKVKVKVGGPTTVTTTPICVEVDQPVKVYDDAALDAAREELAPYYVHQVDSNVLTVIVDDKKDHTVKESAPITVEDGNRSTDLQPLTVEILAPPISLQMLGPTLMAKATGGNSLCGMYTYTWLKNGRPIKEETAFESYLVIPDEKSVDECQVSDFSDGWTHIKFE